VGWFFNVKFQEVHLLYLNVFAKLVMVRLLVMQMPNMDGLQATEAIRDMETQRNWGRLPILGLTAHAIQGYQETCLSHGMDGYLGKPFEIKQLLRQMHELVSSNRGPRDHG